MLEVANQEPTNRPLGLAVPQEPGTGESGQDAGGQEEPARQMAARNKLNLVILVGKISLTYFWPPY